MTSDTQPQTQHVHQKCISARHVGQDVTAASTPARRLQTLHPEPCHLSNTRSHSHSLLQSCLISEVNMCIALALARVLVSVQPHLCLAATGGRRRHNTSVLIVVKLTLPHGAALWLQCTDIVAHTAGATHSRPRTFVTLQASNRADTSSGRASNAMLPTYATL